jgi:hypothetical protein
MGRDAGSGPSWNDVKGWIPASAGMTTIEPGMTAEGAGMAKEGFPIHASTLQRIYASTHLPAPLSFCKLVTKL